MIFFLGAFFISLVVPALWPGIDLTISGFFYRSREGFFLADHPLFLTLHWLAYSGARMLGVFFLVMALAAHFKNRIFLFINAKGWLFLLLALLIGPGLVANAGFKDHWNRPRPREITQFGGSETFSPALVPQTTPRHNSSFVSGDGSFGFFLPAFAFVVPRRKSRVTFWALMGAGVLFGLARIAMGAHFFSDVVYAAAAMLLTSTFLCALMYGRKETALRWRGLFAREPV